MTAMRYLASSALVALVVFAHPLGASAQTAADHEAINELMWRYARALDTYNTEAYVALYTEDGEFSAGTPTRGRAALRAMIDGLRGDRKAGDFSPSGLYHMTTDAWTEFVDATHARHHTYWLTVRAGGGRGAGPGGGGPSIVAAGVGVDELVKVDGKWLIRSRNVAPQD
jgi:hypothetical protein